MTSYIKPSIANKYYAHHKFFIPALKSENEQKFEELNNRYNDRYSELLLENPNTPRASVYTTGEGYAIPCTPELFDLVTAIKQSMPDVDFTLPPNGRFSSFDSGLVYALAMYRPGDIFALGEVGYYQVSSLKDIWQGYSRWDRWGNRSSEAVCAYMVCSPFIDNTRYKEESRGASFKTAKTVEKAVLNAKKSMRSYSPVDSGHALSGVIRDVHVNVVSKASKVFSTISSSIKYDTKMQGNIIKTLHDIVTGHTDKVVNSDVSNYVLEYMKAFNTETECAAREVKATFVMLSRAGEVITVPFHAVNSSVQMQATEAPTVYKSVDTAPESVLGATAVLDMLPMGEYLADVGIRAGDRAYWVEL
jgi:hypothetical protein